MAPKFENGDEVKLVTGRLYASNRLQTAAAAGTKAVVHEVFDKPGGVYKYRVRFGNEFSSIVSQESLKKVHSQALIGPTPEPVQGPDYQAPFQGNGGAIVDAKGKVVVSVFSNDSYNYRKSLATRVAELLNLGVETEEARKRKAIGEAPSFNPEPFKIEDNQPW